MSGPSFRDVQGSQDPEALVHYLAEVSERPDVRAHARMRAQRAEIGAGARVLDVGCGIGSNTKLLAELVGHDGRVVGIDKSDEMITAAEGRVRSGNVSFEVADAEALPFEDREFDALWVERTLVHIGALERALGECKRVLRPGGVAVFAELDYAGVLIDDPRDPDFASMILSETVSSAAHPRVGRELLRHVKTAGLSCEVVMDDLHRTPDFTDLARLLDLEHGCRQAIAKGRATADECRGWWEALASLGEREVFTGLIPLVTVIARA